MTKISRRFVEELKRELPQWVAEGTVTEEAADRLRVHYETLGEESRSGLMRHVETMFRVLCALLLGVGVILLISHNWDMLSPAWRMVLSYGPLLASLGFGAWVMVKDKRSPAWCEPAAILIGASAASAIAIVSQLYHTLGRLEDFLFVWLLLLLPFLYLFRSFALTVIYTIGAVAMCCMTSSFPRGVCFFLAVLPMLCILARPAASAWRKFFGRLMIVAFLGLIWGLGSSFHHTSDTNIWFSCLVLFGAMSVGGAELARREERQWNVFLVLGGGACLVAAFILSSISFRCYWGRGYQAMEWGFLILNLLLLAAMGVVACFRRFRLQWVFPLFLPVLILCSGIVPVTVKLGANIGLAIFGILLMRQGFRSRRPGRINFGMLVLAILIYIRFVSTGNILLMGTSFIGLGLAVGIISVVISRKMRKLEAAK